MKKRILALALTAVMALALVACGGNGTNNTSSNTGNNAGNQTNNSTSDTGDSGAAGGQKVGISMPTQSLERWNRDGSYLDEQFKSAGYETILTYSDNDTNRQVNDIQNMIAEDVDLLVVAAIDGEALNTVMNEAGEAGIPVIAYDRLIMNDNVQYYVSFDNFSVGVLQGQFLEEQLGLAEGTVYNIEFTAGDPADNNAPFFFNGAMSILQPYLDSGVLNCVSEQTEFDVVATEAWDTDTALARAQNILASYYADGTQLDAWLCSNDSTALGVTNSLEANYTGEWPIITGQDCDKPNVKNMISGKQSMSIFKDTRTLASKVVEMVDAVMKGGEAPVNDTTTYDNGTGVIPSYLCEPVFADASNYKELLIDSGYYTEADLQ